MSEIGKITMQVTKTTTPYEWFVRLNEDDTCGYHYQTITRTRDGNGDEVAPIDIKTYPVHSTPDNVAKCAGATLVEMTKRYETISASYKELVDEHEGPGGTAEQLQAARAGLDQAAKQINAMTVELNSAAAVMKEMAAHIEALERAAAASPEAKEPAGQTLTAPNGKKPA